MSEPQTTTMPTSDDAVPGDGDARLNQNSSDVLDLYNHNSNIPIDDFALFANTSVTDWTAADYLSNYVEYVPMPAYFNSDDPMADWYSPMSNFVSPGSFMSHDSPASFMTAMSTYASPAFSIGNGLSPAARIETIREEEPTDSSMPAPLRKLQTEYYDHLQQQNIIQPFDKELNWSGKGQHVTFLPKDSIPLSLLSSLGASMTAKVDKVLCRRIALARKTMRCTQQWKIADALREVHHLQNLRHFHIIQLVGSYLQGRNFSILLYPVADCHLGTFLEDTADMIDTPDLEDLATYGVRTIHLPKFVACLTSAVAYIHEQTTKHMDIKPQNILVRRVDASQWRVYLADFGLSRSFASQGHSQTDGPTSRTPRYCAPEVFQYELRGRSADIFSLGCVFAEIVSVLCGRSTLDFTDHRRSDDGDESFHANLSKVTQWLDALCLESSALLRLLDVGLKVRATIKQMIEHRPDSRPTALQLLHYSTIFQPLNCCELGPEPYVAYEASPSS